MAAKLFQVLYSFVSEILINKIWNFSQGFIMCQTREGNLKSSSDMKITLTVVTFILVLKVTT